MFVRCLEDVDVYEKLAFTYYFGNQRRLKLLSKRESSIESWASKVLQDNKLF